jgi:hypothetical protein
MKKRITRKLMATVAVAMLFVGGAMAQTHNGTAVPGAAADYAASTVEGTTYITEGTTVPMWVEPDGYYHPNYDVATAVYTLTDGFTWTWSGTAVTTLTVTQASPDDNYVTVGAAVGDAGNYVLSVTENTPVGYGGCSGPQVDLNITVVEQPDVTVGGDATYTFCAGAPGFPTDIQSTITGGWQNYRLVWTLEIATLDAANAKDRYYDDETGAGGNAAQKYAVEYTTTVPQAIATAAAAPDLMTVGAFNVITNDLTGDPSATVYTYVLSSINDQASRYGDFITLDGDNTDPGAFTYYAAGLPETVVVTVYPAPVTGPIYHIISTWSN